MAIVGSRRRNTLVDRAFVDKVIQRAIEKWKDVIIVSGGCPKGADDFAENIAKTMALPVHIFRIPKDPPIENKWEFTKRAYARNALIAEDCDVMFALVHRDRTGGTEDAVKKALGLGKIVWLVFEDGSTYLASGDSDAKDADEA